MDFGRGCRTFLFLNLAAAGMFAAAGADAADTGEGGAAMEIQMTSTAFENGGMIPSRYTCEGKDISPALAWSGVPSGAASLALIADDPDAPMGTWVHWVMYNLDPGLTGLAEAVPASAELGSGGLHGTNDFRRPGYGGPCPPSGTHRYFFKLYALDTRLDLKAGATKRELERAMQGHILAEGQYMGRYRKQK